MNRFEKIAYTISHSKIRTAGAIEFIKDKGPLRRDVRVEDFNWSPESLRDLSKILWASQRAHSYAMAAFRLFSKIPSAQISPDGLLGGRGYIQNIRDMRTSLAQAAEVLSSFTDTVDDEINAPHWKTTDGPSEQIQDQAEEVKANPAGFVQEEFQEENPTEVFDEPVANPSAEDLNPEFESGSSDEDGWSSEDSDDSSGQSQFASLPLAESYSDTAVRDKKILERQKKSLESKEEGSKLPGGAGEQKEGLSVPEMTMHTTTPSNGNYASSIDNLMRSYEARIASNHVADSSVDPNSLPGPRILHIGPGEGGFNGDEQYGSDDPTGKDLDSGVNVTDPIYEDWCADGVSGYENPTDQPSIDSPDSLFQTASRLANAPQTYSWLPGSDNSKNLDYYALGLTPEDIAWLRAHSQPDMPKGIAREQPKLDLPQNLWDPSL